MPAPRFRNRRPVTAPKWYEIRNAGGNVPTIELFGDIGCSSEPDPFWGDEGGAGTFKEFCDALKAIGSVPELRVEIHSYGGDVIVGKGIHDKLIEHPANKTAVIYGVCASAATYPALACQKIVMPANSFFLIHNATGMCWGDANEMEGMAKSLCICDESIAALYAARTGKSIDEVLAIMDEDTWMTGTDAVAIGLADEIIEPITIDPASRLAPENFAPRVLNSMPDTARVWFDSRRLTNARRFANQTIIPVNAMTEAELKAAEKKLKADQEAFEKTKNDAAEEAKRIKAEAEAEAEKIRNAAKNPSTPPPAPAVETPPPAAPADINTIVTNAVSAALKDHDEKVVAPIKTELENLRKTAAGGIFNAANAGGPPASNLGGSANGDAPIDFKNMTAEQLVAHGRKKLFEAPPAK